MSAHCSDPRCPTCGSVPVQRVEIRDGWVYVDGVRTREAQPASGTRSDYARKGGRATRGRPPRSRR